MIWVTKIYYARGGHSLIFTYKASRAGGAEDVIDVRGHEELLYSLVSG